MNQAHAHLLPIRLARWTCLLVAGCGLIVQGCVGSPQHPATTQPVTLLSNLATTRPSYWYDKPATYTVESGNFDKLFAACETVARVNFFTLDRTDFRNGILTTAPLVSAQWFEPWRWDARGFYQAKESSTATIRRTIRFEFSRAVDGGWEVAPKVLVERQAISEKRITNVTRFKNVFEAPVGVRKSPFGTEESDLGIALPERYWYVLRRDELFERAVASAVQRRVNHS